MQDRTTRPLLLSIMQYEVPLAAGTMDVLGVLAKARAFGVDGVELRPEAWPAYQRELPAVRARLAEEGLLVTWATRSLLFGDAQAQATLRADVDAAQRLGAPLVRLFSGAVPPDDDAAAWAGAAAAVAYAAERGVVLALENYSGTPGGTLAEVRRVLERLPSPALGTTYDMGNYAVRGEDPLAALRVVGPRVVYAHLKDGPFVAGGAPPFQGAPPFTYLGGGSLPLREILAGLDALPGRILYTFEFRGGGDPDGRIRASLAFLQAFQVPGT